MLDAYFHVKLEGMYAVIYSFKAKHGLESAFVKAWSELTEQIKEHCGSLGSRLHQAEDGTFVAYAQWPSKEVFETAWDRLPKSASEISQTMKACSTGSSILFQMEMTSDLLSPLSD